MTVSRLIATDEAGYGPTLGPLVITAGAWTCAPDRPLSDQFAPFHDGFELPPIGTIRLADSKELYAPQSKAGLSLLAAGIAAILDHAGLEYHDDCELIRAIAREDWEILQRQRWYDRSLEEERQPLLSGDCRADLPSASACWRGEQSPRLKSLQARILEPAEFNRGCQRTGNKASLLTELALKLIGDEVRQTGPGTYDVWCDKHGGRNRYAAVLLNEFPEALLTIDKESRSESRYRLQFDGTDIRIRFCAKGDGFAPVAFSSMVAKFVRERLMARFNRFWRRFDADLRPTAGYARDASRFLTDISDLIGPAGIEHDQLVRSR